MSSHGTNAPIYAMMERMQTILRSVLLPPMLGPESRRNSSKLTVLGT